MDAIKRLEISKREAWLRIGRYALPIFLVVAIPLVLGIFLWSSVPRDPLKTACEKIEYGMLSKEVQEIVGHTKVSSWWSSRREMDGVGMMVFDSDQGELMIIQTSDGRVAKKEYREFRRRETFFARLRRWVGI